MTNPALVLRFGPRLAADVLWPDSQNVPIDLTDFLVLNHCLPSTRGDRDTSMRGVVEAVPGATEASIQRLRDSSALLAVRDAQLLYGGSWQSGRLERVGDAPERAAVATTSAGQTATSTGALTLWISNLTDPGQPARYVMDLIDLGRLGQRICLIGAELGIGVFLTPAVHDRGACALLGLADAECRLTYVFGLGVRAATP